MQAYVFESKYADDSSKFKASDLKFHGNYDIPTPNDDQILVKVRACGLNPVDYKVWVSRPTPIIPGYDIAGTVKIIGANVKGFEINDRVYYHGNINQVNGGYATYAIINAKTVAHIPKEVSYVDAAALPTACWTAYVALFEKVRARKGETVVITAGSGGVGGFAIQLAKIAGLTVISTCSSKNMGRVRTLGADYVIDYNNEDIKKQVMNITKNKGADIWIDMISVESADLGLECLCFGGHLVVIQNNPKTTLGDLFKKQISVHEVFLGGAHTADEQSQKNLARIGTEMITWLKERKIESMVKEVIPFSEIPQALQRLRERHVVGKIVVNMDLSD